MIGARHANRIVESDLKIRIDDAGKSNFRFPSALRQQVPIRVDPGHRAATPGAGNKAPAVKTLYAIAATST